ncbi:MAG: hypothetical protein CSB44_03620 [Gammaproteobacteria bacterium]|nr:MAG: hypothetical protein CSB44_03620 [Gammaproteobacteria bacterium]
MLKVWFSILLEHTGLLCDRLHCPEGTTERRGRDRIEDLSHPGITGDLVKPIESLEVADHRFVATNAVLELKHRWHFELEHGEARHQGLAERIIDLALLPGSR